MRQTSQRGTPPPDPPPPDPPLRGRLWGRQGITRQPENSKRAHLTAPAFPNTTKIHEKTPREKERKWGPKFWVVTGFTTVVAGSAATCCRNRTCLCKPALRSCISFLLQLLDALTCPLGERMGLGLLDFQWPFLGRAFWKALRKLMAAHGGQPPNSTLSNVHVAKLRLDRGRACCFVGRAVELELAPVGCLSVACDLMKPQATSPTSVEVHGEPGPNWECPLPSIPCDACCDVLPGTKITKIELVVRTNNTTFEPRWLEPISVLHRNTMTC